MITLYDSDAALSALIGALESDHLNETNSIIVFAISG